MVCCSLDSAPYVHFDAPTPCSQILENPYSSNCHAKIFQGRLPHCMRQINSTACIQYVATSKSATWNHSQYPPYATRSIMHNDYGRNANNTPQQLVYAYTPEFFYRRPTAPRKQNSRPRPPRPRTWVDPIWVIGVAFLGGAENQAPGVHEARKEITI
jgi:hypothetical protein